jgi:large subunit ribosomal protein L10e
MHGANYRDGTGQPFTRKKYIKGKPQIKIAKFQGGSKVGKKQNTSFVFNYS